MKNLTIETLMRSGVHYGNLTNKWNPRMAPYIYGERDNLHIIDLDQTIISLKKASLVVNQIFNSGGTILIVGTNEITSHCAKYFGNLNNFFYLHKKWYGGLLTNWNHFQNFFVNLKLKNSELAELTPSSLKKHKRLYNSLEGVVDMKKTPSLIIILNVNDHSLAIKEALQMNIPTIGFVDTDCDPLGITYPIPSNNDNISSIKLLLSILTKNN